VNTDDHQSVVGVFSIPFPEVGKRPDAIDAGIGPEIDQHHLATEFFYGQGFTVDPGFDPFDLRRLKTRAGNGDHKQGHCS